MKNVENKLSQYFNHMDDNLRSIISRDIHNDLINNIERHTSDVVLLVHNIVILVCDDVNNRLENEERV